MRAQPQQISTNGSGPVVCLVELFVGGGAGLLSRLVGVGRLVGQLGLLLLKIFRIKENISLKYFTKIFHLEPLGVAVGSGPVTTIGEVSVKGTV